jgi:TonB family protein
MLAIAAAAQVSGSPEPMERRGNVTYSAEDWSRPDPRHTVDVPAQPFGGMKAFVSRLDYPADLRRQLVTGIVRVEISLNAQGRVLSSKIIHSVHPRLDAIVLDAVREAKWKAAIKGCRPVAWTFRFPVTFNVRPNKTMRPTAVRSTASVSMINTRLFQFTLAPASGG